MQEHTVELALARVVDAIEVMYSDLLEGLQVSNDNIIIVPKEIGAKWVQILGHFPDVSTHEEPSMPDLWRDTERYTFICRVVKVLRHGLEVGQMPATRARQFVNALGTLAASQPSAIVNSRSLIISTCVHKPS